MTFKAGDKVTHISDDNLMLYEVKNVDIPYNIIFNKGILNWI